MPPEPAIKRAYTFLDGQNLFFAVKEALRCEYPNYDPIKLSEEICRMKNRQLSGIYFYTGLPSAKDDPFWNRFWSKKLAVLRTRGVKTYGRELRYHKTKITLSDGTVTYAVSPKEKGIDVRLALDAVRLARENQLDVAVIFSQDQDFTEVVKEIKRISIQQSRWIRVACAFPISRSSPNTRDIDGTEWISIDKILYDSCIDTNDYRPKKAGRNACGNDFFGGLIDGKRREG